MGAIPQVLVPRLFPPQDLQEFLLEYLREERNPILDPVRIRGYQGFRE